MRRLFIDVTRTTQSGLHTGIQRVVRRLLRAMCADAHRQAVRVQGAVFASDQWFACGQVPAHALECIGLTSPAPAQAETEALSKPNKPVEFDDGDVLLLADSSWYLDPWPAVDAALARHAQVAGLVHDLFPILHPEWFRPGLAPRFASHLHAMAQRASLLITPTQAVAESLRRYLADVCGDDAPPVITQHLGADFSRDVCSPIEPAPCLTNIPIAPFALMVGTIEPRKNHQTVLQAFEQLWSQGLALHLVLVGAAGWNCEALIQRIATHAELGQRLHWLRQVDDRQLAQLYRQARVLAFPSLNEGFGLPLVEAAHLGCPILASDVGVLREVGGDWPRYLPARDSARWAAALQAPPPRCGQMPHFPKWSHVGERFFSHLRNMRRRPITQPV